jgi:hypothetical protein
MASKKKRKANPKALAAGGKKQQAAPKKRASGRRATSKEDPDLVALRDLKIGIVAQLKAKAAAMPDVELFTTAGGSSSRSFSPKQLVREIERETPLGKRMLHSAMVLSTTKALSGL